MSVTPPAPKLPFIDYGRFDQWRGVDDLPVLVRPDGDRYRLAASPLEDSAQQWLESTGLAGQRLRRLKDVRDAVVMAKMISTALHPVPYWTVNLPSRPTRYEDGPFVVRHRDTCMVVRRPSDRCWDCAYHPDSGSVLRRTFAAPIQVLRYFSAQLLIDSEGDS